MSAFDSGTRDYLDKVNLFDGLPDLGPETKYEENLDVSIDYWKEEMQSMSGKNLFAESVYDQLQKIYKIENPEYDPSEPSLLLGEGPTDYKFAYEENKEKLRDQTFKILDLQKKHPDAGLLTWDQIMYAAQNKSAKLRERLLTVQENRTWGGVMGEVVGGLYGAISDPIVLLSMTLGTKGIYGFGKLGNAGRAFATEAAIGLGAETLIQPYVLSHKGQLESPYSLKEAALTVMMVGGFAGVLRAGGSLTIDLVQAGKASKTLRAKGDTASADVLDSYIDLYQNAPRAGDVLDAEAHIKVIDEVQKAADQGRILSQAEIDKIGARGSIETVDPHAIKVDAETFQFKARGDEEGVTDALQGVTKWDQHQAGVVMVWERQDGTRFIVDGHQRLALAKRLINEGTPAEEVNLNAFILREADGFTPAMARERAAIVNIGQGTGTALDAAKVLRTAGEEGRTFIDSLPPNSVLVKNARGLAKLDDDSFRLIIDDLVEERFGAIVGELIKDGANQAAAIRALAKAKPQNLTQARSMVMDMNSAGFTKVKTDDLFGGVEFSESLIKERAQVLDSVIKRLRKDKQVFKTLAEQEARISGTGTNFLDRAANLQRLTSDELALATLTALANSKGPVSDAINEAASKLKAGSSLKESTQGIVKSVKQAIKDGGIEPTAKIATEIGQAVKLKDLTKLEKQEAEKLFRSKQRESIKTIDDLYGKNNEIAIAHQKRLNQVGRQIKKDTGIRYATPPFRAAKDQIKARARVKEKVEDKYGGHYHHITDIVRASFVIERTAEVARVIKRLEKEFEVLDEGFAHNIGNYLDRKVLVRFKDGRIGEIQIVEKNFYHAKYKEGGNELYYKLRTLDEVKDAKEFKRLRTEMEDLYGAALNRSNKEWKSLSETLSASDKTSTRLTSRQGSPGSALEKALADSEVTTKTAGIPSHQAKPVTLSQSNKSIDPIIRQDTESIYLNDPELKRIMDEEVIEAQRIIDEAGDDLEVPFTLIDDLGNEVTIVEGVKKVFNDLDEEQNSLDSLNKCMGRAA